MMQRAPANGYKQIAIYFFEMRKLTLILTGMLLFMGCFSLYAKQPPALYKFDMKAFLREHHNISYNYDVFTFIASLQGLENRSGNRLYINYCGNDGFWFDYIKENSNLFQGQKVIQLTSFKALLKAFAKDIKGVVLWDETVPATSNVAATICGVEGWIPVRKSTAEGSLYHQVVLHGYRFPVKKDLTGMFTGVGLIPGSNTPTTGSRKCDAYLWAKEQYLDKGLCNDSLMGYILDAWPYVKPFKAKSLGNSMVANHDYLIAKKAFFFDLSPWGDEPPVDDQSQPLGADLNTFKKILLSQYQLNGGKKITTICGFTPWQFKYTTTRNAGKHGGVATEWEQVRLQSAYNAILDADAPSPMDIANASVFCHFPLKKAYFQNPDERPRTKEVENKSYILIYMGDWDGSAWTAGVLPGLWADTCRGSIPLMWAVNPNLSERIPMVFDWLYRHKTRNDYLSSGDSGAGYLNPSLLLEAERRPVSGLPSGMDTWIKFNQYYFKKFDLSIVGFIINGRQPINMAVQMAYAQFATTGVAYLPHSPGISNVVHGVPFITQALDIPANMEQATQLIYQRTKGMPAPGGQLKAPHFYVYRAIRFSPTRVKELMERIKKEKPACHYELLDPYTFFYLYKKYAQSSGKPLRAITFVP
jgi:hypothetical protein